MTKSLDPPSDQREKLNADYHPKIRALVALLRNRWVMMILLKIGKLIYEALSDS